MLLAGFALCPPAFAQSLDEIITEIPPDVADITPLGEQAVAAFNRQDFRSLLEMVRPLALQGNSGARVLMGRFYGIGLGIPRDDTQARGWYRLAAELGHAEGMNSLGYKY